MPVPARIRPRTSLTSPSSRPAAFERVFIQSAHRNAGHGRVHRLCHGVRIAALRAEDQHGCPGGGIVFDRAVAVQKSVGIEIVEKDRGLAEQTLAGKLRKELLPRSRRAGRRIRQLHAEQKLRRGNAHRFLSAHPGGQKRFGRAVVALRLLAGRVRQYLARRRRDRLGVYIADAAEHHV